MKSRIAQNLILSIITLCFMFVIGEAAINVLNAVNSAKYKSPDLSRIEDMRGARPDPVLNHTHIPGLKFVYRAQDRKEFENSVEYNSRGLNDYEYDYKKPQDTMRILVFGDSFVEALQVEREENFCELMEKALNAESPSPGYEVINMGISGYSPILEYLYLKKEGLKYEPDIVVLCFFMNDVYEDSAYKSMAFFDASGLPLSVHWRGFDKTQNLKSWKKWERAVCNSVKGVLNKSKFYVFLKKRFYRLLAMLKLKKPEGERNPFFVLSGNAISEEPALWADTFRYISAIQDMAWAKGAKFLLVIIPIEAQLYENPRDAAFKAYFSEKPDSQRANDMIARFCSQQRIDPSTEPSAALQGGDKAPLEGQSRAVRQAHGASNGAEQSRSTSSGLHGSTGSPCPEPVEGQTGVRRGVDCLNLMHEFKRKRSEGLYFKNDGHFTAKGHREVADIILRKLEILGWIKQPS